MLRLLTILALLAHTFLLGQGVVLVEDIRPDIGSLPVFIGEINGKVIFHAQTTELSAEPYISDGTPEGTFLLGDIFTGNGASFPRRGHTYNDHFYFFARYDSEYSTDLCRTDGTPEGTGIFLDVAPGLGDYSEAGGEFAEFNGLLYFLDRPLNAAAVGAGLWRTDGTQAGTTMVSETLRVHDGAGTSIAVHDDHLYFASFGNPALHTLYKMDAAGGLEAVFAHPDLTLRISRIIPAESGLYFALGDPAQLWWTDGTTSGTLQLTELDGQGVFGASHNHNKSSFCVVGDTLFFGAGDAATGQEPWRSDGTVAGTHPLADLNPGSPSSTPVSFFPLGDKVYFSAWQPPFNMDVLCRTDGTVPGTVVIDTLDYLEIYGPRNEVLYAIGGSPGQVHVLEENTGQLTPITTIDGDACCSWVRDMAWGDAGLFLSASSPEFSEELFLMTAPVDVRSLQSPPAISVYPNPVQHMLKVVLPTGGPAILNVSDALGRSVRTSTTTSLRTDLYVGDLPPGTYLLSSIVEGKRSSACFIKE